MNLDKLIAGRRKKPVKSHSISLSELCERYEGVFTSAVNDALRERDLVYQTLPNRIMPLRDKMKVAGPAFTVKGAKSLEISNEMEERVQMLESIYENSVVIWDTDEDEESAQWGEVMTMAAVKRGCRGAVVDGGVRDTNRVLDQGFPVFVRYRSSNGMLGRFRITGWNEPIRIGNVNIFPADIVFGDIDGVIVVPQDIAYDVLLRSEEIRDTETDIKKWIDEGCTPKEVVRKGGYF